MASSETPVEAPPSSARRSRGLARIKVGIRSEFHLVLFVTAFNALPFVLAPMKAAALGPAERGYFAYFQAALLIIINISVLGSRLSAYKNSAFKSRRFDVPARPLVTLTLPIALLLGLCTLVLKVDLPLAVQIGIGVAAITAPLYTVLQVEMAHVQSQFLSMRILMLSAIPTAVDFILSASLLAFGHFTLRSAIAIALLAESARLGVVLTSRLVDRSRYRRAQDGSDQTRPDRLGTFWRDSLRYSLPSGAPVLTSNVDVLIFGAVASPSELGLYAIAKIGFNLTQLAGQSVEGRALAALRAGPRSKAFRRTSTSFVGLCGLIALMGSGAVLILFPNEFSPAAQVVPVLVAGGAFFTYSRWVLANLAIVGNAAASWMVSLLTIAACVGSSCLIAATGNQSVMTMGILFTSAQLVSLICVTVAAFILNSRSTATSREGY